MTGVPVKPLWLAEPFSTFGGRNALIMTRDDGAHARRGEVSANGVSPMSVFSQKRSTRSNISSFPLSGG